MTTTLSNPNYTSKSSDTPTTPATASFDEFAQSRANASNNSASITTIDANERSNLSTSFAIPSNVSIIEYLKKRAEPITNKFMLAPPSASTINIRRNSTQQASSSGTGSSQQSQSVSGETSETSSIAAGVAAITATTKTVAATTTVAVAAVATKAAAAAAATASTSTLSSSEVPPPIPKRTFLGKIIQSSLSDSSSQSPTSTIKTTINNVCKQTLDEVKRRNTSVKPVINQNQTVIQRRLVENHYPIDQQYSDDDRLSIESSVFEEPKSSDPIISLSNRSSSDSNKSQTTIDTGYMSASNDNDRIFFGASEDFRSRFSSVDTQSSIDSCTSSDLQTHQSFTLQNQVAARCIISPLAVKRDEYEDKFNNQAPLHGKTFGRFNSSNSLLSVSNKTINSNSSNSIKNQSIGSNVSSRGSCSGSIGGGLNAYRNQTMTKMIPSQINGLNQSKTRPAPPPAPTSRTQPTNSLDSGRILYNGSMLGAFQSGLAKITSAAATTSEVVMGRRSFKKASQIAHTKLTQRQDSSISNDSFSLNSSPSYNTKQSDAPLLAGTSTSMKNNSRTSCLNGGQEMMVAAAINNHSHVVSGGGGGDGFSNNKYHFPGRGTLRQDSTISNDSFSLNSSPGYNTKQLEQPLLAHSAKIHAMKQHLKCADEITKENLDNSANSAIIKSASTPASLQAVVRFQNGSNMSLQHKVINRRKSSNPYITRGILKFRLLQILLNALALLIIAGGLAAYFKAYPTVKFINKTIITPQRPAPSAVTPIKETPKKQLITGQFDKNPAPGICLPIIVKFCQTHQVPYNYTIYPNYIGHFSQIEAEEDLEPYEAIVDVQCYELASLFLCTLFVPKCGTAGLIPPCKSLCMETMRRCRFFFNVFGLELPDYLSCHQFSDSNNPDICVGQKQMRDAYNRALKPVCSGFSCDNKTRCIPGDWKCDGHVDCLDQSDESNCEKCGNDTIYCGENRCMSSQHVCDGEINCPYGQDERNCVRLSERNGDLGKGILEIYKVSLKKWVPACVANWHQTTSPTMVCSLLGYNSVNSSRVATRNTNQTLTPSSTNTKDPNNIARMYQRKKTNLIKEFGSCTSNENHAVLDLTCTNYECGRVRNRPARARTRIVGGSESSPGDWPFLAAILGGPEEVFYCAGVLIADQWVLTASHCIGNKSLHNINSWTIQLGITRRNSHTYYGQKVKVQRVLPHPQYNLDVMHDNDIALFQLATRVAFHEHLLPVCLPPPHKRIKPGTMCTVIGWGKKEDKKPSTSYEPTVNEVNVPVLNRDLCNEWLVHLNVTDGMICAGYSEGGKDACQGDSGGPLLCNSNDRERYWVAGIVSWGVKCANPKLPGVYANVPKYVPWIMENIHNYSNLPVEYPRSTNNNNSNNNSNSNSNNMNNNRKTNKSFQRQHRQRS